MQYLGIKQKFILAKKTSQRDISLTQISETEVELHDLRPRSKLDGVKQSVFDDLSLSEAPLSSRSNRGNVAYSAAIKDIERIQTCNNPAEMLACISASFGSLKAAVVDHSRGKYELAEMDDVLPVSIYVVAMAELSHPSSHRNMMEDYLRSNQRGYDLERKLICNFDCAVRYIANDWELTQ